MRVEIKDELMRAYRQTRHVMGQRLFLLDHYSYEKLMSEFDISCKYTHVNNQGKILFMGIPVVEATYAKGIEVVEVVKWYE